MAKTPPAAVAAAAPVLDQEVESPADGEVPSKKRFTLKMPAFVARLSKLDLKSRMPFRITLSKKLLILIGASVLTVSAGAAALAFWPSEPEVVKKPVLAKKSKKGKKSKRVAPAASAASAAASAVEPTEMAATAPAETTARVARGASEPEDPMDKLRRRLGETLCSGGKLENGAPGELKLTARQGDPKIMPAARVTARMEPAADQSASRGETVGATKTARTRTDVSDDHAAHHDAKATALQALQWTYDGDGGPGSWGKLKPDFAKCASGTRQSPIDIRDGIQVNLDPIQFDYKPTTFRVIDNGHTVQVNVAPGNFIEVNGKRFELLEFHFHRPSEERIQGKQFDMAVHLVHKDAEGRLALVAVLLERGGAHSIVQTVWNNLPLEKGEEQAARVPLDLTQLLPAERSYYTYMGSLTTPPCSEGVLWLVMKKPVPIAQEQIGIFARLYPMNARPVQPASGRMIKESN